MSCADLKFVMQGLGTRVQVQARYNKLVIAMDDAKRLKAAKNGLAKKAKKAPAKAPVKKASVKKASVKKPPVKKAVAVAHYSNAMQDLIAEQVNKGVENNLMAANAKAFKRTTSGGLRPSAAWFKFKGDGYKVVYGGKLHKIAFTKGGVARWVPVR
jgi:hypothetical protein